MMALLLLLLLPTAQAGALRLAGVFGSNMVLQHGKPAAIWGSAAPAGLISATLVDARTGAVIQRARATASTENGTFSIIFAPQPASSSPVTVNISSMLSSVAETLTLQNVVFGHVLLCAGQVCMT